MKRSASSYSNNSGIIRFRIDEILKDRGLTQAWLSKETGVSRGSISRAMKGEQISLPMLAEIARALRVEVGELFATTGWAEKESQDYDAMMYCEDVYSSDGKELSFEYDDVMKRHEDDVKAKRDAIGYMYYDIFDFVLTDSDKRKLSRVLCTSFADVSKILSGRKEITVNQWVLIVKALGYKALLGLKGVKIRTCYDEVVTIANITRNDILSNKCIEYEKDEEFDV